MTITNWAIAQIPTGHGRGVWFALLGNDENGKFITSHPLVAYDYQAHEFVCSKGERYRAATEDIDPNEVTRYPHYKAAFVAKLKPLNRAPVA